MLGGRESVREGRRWGNNTFREMGLGFPQEREREKGRCQSSQEGEREMKWGTLLDRERGSSAGVAVPES